MYSNGYIFRYAAIMVILVAAILSATAMLLKPYQQRNEAIEKMQSILKAADIEDVNTDNTIELFNKHITNMIVINNQGNVVDDFTGSNKEDSKAFKINLKDELYKKSQNQYFELPLYVIENNNKKINVIPLSGTGLWGGIWGNIALNETFEEVVGVTFGHKSETPGLGAEITSAPFQEQFKGKTIFENGQFVSVKVVKGGIQNLPVDQQIHNVDAISGGTITSNGVSTMIQNVIESYTVYISKMNH